MENQTTKVTKEDENMKNVPEGNQVPVDQQQGNQQTPPAPTVNEPGKVKSFLGKAGNAVKKALPYVGAAVAGAAVTAGAIVVALCKGEPNDDVPALEERDDLIDSEEFIDGTAEFVGDSNAE